MAWDDWERLKSTAGGQQPTGMQLNQVPADPGGSGTGGLVVNQDDLGAVGHEAFVLHGELGKGADLAGMGADKSGAGSTMQASSELSRNHFALGPALGTALSMWDTSLKTLLQACAHISNHLDYSKGQHANDDAQIAASLRHRDGSAESWSKINEYFK